MTKKEIKQNDEHTFQILNAVSESIIPIFFWIIKKIPYALIILFIVWFIIKWPIKP